MYELLIITMIIVLGMIAFYWIGTWANVIKREQEIELERLKGRKTTKGDL